MSEGVLLKCKCKHATYFCLDSILSTFQGNLSLTKNNKVKIIPPEQIPEVPTLTSCSAFWRFGSSLLSTLAAVVRK